MWPAVKKNLRPDEVGAYIASLRWGAWRPRMIVLHNTAAPTLAQWHSSEAQDAAAGRAPGWQRICNLESYYANQRGWSGGPHLFVADDFVWVFNPLTAPGVHSPSWNHVSIGIECVGDYEHGVEDDDSGPGLKVKLNAIAAMAALCQALGLDPHEDIRLHREDPKTTHKCPGDDMAEDKADIIAAVTSLMDGGEHGVDDVAVAIKVAEPQPHPQDTKYPTGEVTASSLRFRSGPSLSAAATGSLPRGTELRIVGEDGNAGEGWLRVATPDGFVGWVAGRYVERD